MPREPDYEVGYKKPPKDTQFKKGQSGNRRGRPRGAKNLATFLDEVLDEKVTVNENGLLRKVTKAEAMLKQLVNHGVQGDDKATQAVVRIMEMFYRTKKLRSTLETRTAPGPGCVVVLPHNNRDQLDPELIAAYANTKEKHTPRKRRKQEGANPANENEEEVPDLQSSAA